MKQHASNFSPAGKLLILGDSISLGVAEVRGNDVVSRVENGYVDLLRLALPNVQIAVDADLYRTTSAIRDSVAKVLSEQKPDVVLIMLGGNDADLDWRRFVLSEGKVARSRIGVEIYEKNLRQIVDHILAAGAIAVLTDMPNHHFELRGPYVSQIAGKDVTTMLTRGGGQAASDLELVKYRAAVNRVAVDLNLPVAGYGAVLDAHPPREMAGVDGAHPSQLAHHLIADTMLPILKSAFRRHQSARLSPITGLSA